MAPAASLDLKWSKTEVGTVLSSFFWGYTLTQILGGYLSDRFGSERVLFGAGLGWGLLTFWFHQIVYFSSDHDTALRHIVISRVLLGAYLDTSFLISLLETINALVFFRSMSGRPLSCHGFNIVQELECT